MMPTTSSAGSLLFGSHRALGLALLLSLGACGPCRPGGGQDAGPTTRGLNEACDANNTCGMAGNAMLSCIGGTCQRSDCLSGVTNCPCGANNSCQDTTVMCVGGTCVDPGCMVGTSGCPCDNGACQGGLMCSNNICRAGGESGLTISGMDARGCDVLLADPDHAVLGVRFGTTVEGKWLRRNDRVATSFVNKTNTAFSGGAVTVELATGVSAANVAVVSGSCVGQDGRAVASATVTLAP